MNKKYANLLVCAVIGLLMSGLLDGCDQEKGINPWAYPENPPAGIYNPNAPQMELIYRLPHPWQTNSERTELSTLLVDGNQLASLLIYWEKEPVNSPQKARDQEYDHVFCQKNEEKDPFINCQKGFVREKVELGGVEAEKLSYFGTPLGQNAQVHHVYLNYQGGLLSLLGEGSWSDLEPAFISIVKTLSFETSDPQAEQHGQPRELLGL